jgi:hypothetical protein
MILKLIHDTVFFAGIHDTGCFTQVQLSLQFIQDTRFREEGFPSASRPIFILEQQQFAPLFGIATRASR